MLHFPQPWWSNFDLFLLLLVLEFLNLHQSSCSRCMFHNDSSSSLASSLSLSLVHRISCCSNTGEEVVVTFDQLIWGKVWRICFLSITHYHLLLLPILLLLLHYHLIIIDFYMTVTDCPLIINKWLKSDHHMILSDSNLITSHCLAQLPFDTVVTIPTILHLEERHKVYRERVCNLILAN